MKSLITDHLYYGCYRRFVVSENRSQNLSQREKIVKMTGMFVCLRLYGPVNTVMVRSRPSVNLHILTLFLGRLRPPTLYERSFRSSFCHEVAQMTILSTVILYFNVQFIQCIVTGHSWLFQSGTTSSRSGWAGDTSWRDRFRGRERKKTWGGRGQWRRRGAGWWGRLVRKCHSSWILISANESTVKKKIVK